MPEPVVIIGPAAGPAGPKVFRPSDPEAPAIEAKPDAAPEEAAGPSFSLRILGFALSLLRRMARAIAAVIVYVIREYPRHSIAAAASAVILGAILYSQSSSGTGRGGVTNAINGNASLAPPVSKLPGNEPGKEVAAAPKSGASAPATTSAADPPKAPAPESNETKTAQNDVPSEPSVPAPKPESTPPDSPPPTALAQAGGAEKPAGGQESAHAPGASSPDPAAAPLPAPPASDSAKATLLAEASAPAPVGDQAAKTKATPDVPPDLWLPEAAPKPAADDASKSAKTGETAAAAAPGGESKPPDDSKEAAGSASKPVEPSRTVPGESATVPVAPPTAPSSAAQAPQDTKPDTASETIDPGSMKEIEPPATVPQTGIAAASEKKPAPPAQEAGSAPGDSSAPPPAPAAEAPGSSIEKPTGSASGPDAPSSPAPPPAREDAISGIAPPAERERERSVNADAVAASQPKTEPKADAVSPKSVTKAGWIVIPNTGKLPLDPTESPTGGPGDSRTLDGSEPATSAGDFRAHAARDVAFEPEASQSNSNQRPAVASDGGDGRRTSRPAMAPQPRAASHSARVEATEHLVERGENYWTISRQYYSSGRYYRALWKANEAKYPDINVLHVGDVIVVPAVEDLDPDQILPANTGARSVSLAAAGPSRSGGGRSRRDEAARSDEQPDKEKSRSTSDVVGGDVDETESRTSARPRAGGSAPGRPAYRVHSYDTLRSIARDTLGSARRADEILDLNRGLIDNPNQLVVGQVLELPEDARTSIRRPGGR
jgi:LysM domain